MSSHTHAHTDSTKGLPKFADIEGTMLAMQDILGRKWHPVLLYYLISDGPLGFSDLKTRVAGISSKMLSESLQDLEDADLVARDVLEEHPVRVEYTVTDTGRTLEPLLTELVRWGAEHDLAGTGSESTAPSTERGTGHPTQEGR